MPMENLYMQLVADAKFQAFRARVLRKLKPPAQREKERKAKVSAASKHRRATDPAYAMTVRTRSLISNAFIRRGLRKPAKTEAILGCSIEAFRAHLERQFLPGMTWENRALWHIDHIVALATAVTEADVLALNHFTNLRPLWGPDNLSKRDKALFLL